MRLFGQAAEQADQRFDLGQRCGTEVQRRRARACGVRHLAPVGQLRIAIVTDPLAGPGRRGPAQPRAGVEGGRSWARSAAIDGALLHPAAPKLRSPRRSAFSGISQLPRLTPWSTTALPSAVTHCVPWVRTIGSGPARHQDADRQGRPQRGRPPGAQAASRAKQSSSSRRQRALSAAGAKLASKLLQASAWASAGPSCGKAAKVSTKFWLM